jgi:glycerophosphoryl diester phosphodiesterase
MLKGETNMKIIAHRGVSAYYHENTLLAFQKALELGVYAIEVDLHQVEDQFAIFHDFELDRLANTRADLADLSLRELADVRLEGGLKIPLLPELFDLVQGKTVLNLELKYVKHPQDLIAQVSHYIDQFNGEVVISSFNHPLLLQIQALLRNAGLHQNIKIAALVGHLPIDNAHYARSLGADIAAIDAALVTKDFVEHAHQQNMQVWCYTVNYEKGFRNLKTMGVDAVFSNDPALMASLLTD